MSVNQTGWILYRSDFVEADEGPLTSTPLVATAPSNLIFVEGWDNMRVRYLGDAEGEEVITTVYAVDPISADSTQINKANGFTVTDLGTLTWTTGSKTGIAGHTLIPTTSFWADTLAVVQQTSGVLVGQHFNSMGTRTTRVGAEGDAICQYSPADNTVAEAQVHIPPCWAMVIEFTTTNSRAGNILYNLNKFRPTD